MRTQRTSTFLLSFVVRRAALRAASASLPVKVCSWTPPSVTMTTAVRALIAKRANVNEPARDGSTALLWAAYHSDLEMTRALLAAGAKVELAEQVRHHAAAAGEPHRRRRRSCRRCSAGADAIAGTSRRRDAADGRGACRQRPTRCRLLLEAGADVNAADAYQQETALMWAAAEGHADVVKALLDAKADPNRKARVTDARRAQARRSPDRRLHGADVRGAQRSRSGGPRARSRAAPIRS